MFKKLRVMVGIWGEKWFLWKLRGECDTGALEVKRMYSSKEPGLTNWTETRVIPE